MSCHLKSLGHLVYQATTQESYPNASKYRKANALALKTLKASLNKDLLHVFDHYDSAFCSLEHIDFSRATKDYQQVEKI